MKQMELLLKQMKRRAAKRKRQVKAIPGIRDGKTLLYVGASPDRFELVDLFRGWGYKIDVLEIWPKNVEKLKKLNAQVSVFRDIILGDIRNCGSSFNNTYDVSVWWHGPEHVEKHEFPQALKHLEERTKRLVILGCPWGDYSQGPVKGNVYEIHKSVFYPKDFEELGYTTKTLKKNGKRGSNILAWKEISNGS